MNMSETLTVECAVHFERRTKGRKDLAVGPALEPLNVEPGRVPRVAKLMALAIRFDGLVRSGAVRDFAQLAALGHVTRARVSQVMNLLNLAPDVQEELLFLPRTVHGNDPVILAHLQPIATEMEWKKQRRMWATLTSQGRRHATKKT